MGSHIYQVAWYDPRTGAAGESLVYGRLNAIRRLWAYMRGGIVGISISRWC
jgi:hypothetical protein